jgi:Tfp pilus assembly protein PilN
MAKRTQKNIKLVVGGESRVDLLPLEVTARAQARTTRRGMVGVVALGLLVSAGAFVFATTIAGGSESRLAAEQERTRQLIATKGEFAEVTAIETQHTIGIAAAQIGASTEVDWKVFIGDVQGRLPEGVVIQGFVADTATPLQAYEQSESPLQGARIATLVFTAQSADLPQVEQWLNSLEQVVGFADATPGSITADEEGGYKTTITMHINTSAYSGRFAPAEVVEEEK